MPEDIVRKIMSRRSVLPKGTYMRAKVHWVKPRLLAQVEFTEWTRDRILRHLSFLGLREDKDPREVVIDIETPGSVPE
jgi:bifunctional non-homologous end joining protein LigD